MSREPENETPDVQEYLKTLTLLFVEDEKDAREQCGEFLSRYAGTLLTAENGAEGLAAYRLHRPDIVVTDIHMPLMDGLSMSSAIRDLDPSVPILVVTAFDEANYLKRAINIGIDHYVCKPVDSSLLRTALLKCAATLLSQKQLRDSLEELENRRRRLTSIIEGTQAATWEWNIQTGETIVNEQWAEMIGYRLEELAPLSISTWERFCHPDDYRTSARLFKQHLQGESEFYQCDVRMKHKDSRWVWIHDRGKIASWGPDGTPLWMFGTHTDITERVLAAQELRRVSDERNTILEGCGVGIVFVCDRRMQWSNSTFRSMFGYNAEEIVNVSTRLLYPSREEYEQFGRECYSALGRGETFVQTRLMKCKDGTLLDVEMYGMSVDPQNATSDSIWVFTDVSAQKKMESDLRQARRKSESANEILQSIIENISDWAWSIDSDGRYTHCSPQIEKVLGYTPADVIGRTPLDFMDFEEAERVKSLMSDIRRNKTRIIDLEHWKIRKDGRKVLLRKNGVPIFDESGALLGYQGIEKDITEGRLIFRRLSQAIDQSPLAVMVTDREGILEYVNAAFCAISGYVADEAVGRNPRFLKSDVTPAHVYTDMWATITAGKIWEGELCNKSKGGTLFWKRLTISPFCDDASEMTHYIAFGEDITEKRNITEQLFQAQKLESVGQLAGGLAHDLNNILCVIDGYAIMHATKTEQTPAQARYISEIRDASKRAATLVSGLLAFSRKQPTQQRRQDLNQLVTKISPSVELIIGCATELVITLGAEPLTVCVDTIQIEQVLLNLATNARDAMPTGGTVRIQTKESIIDETASRKAGRYAAIEFSDTGSGMDETTLQKVFDPFFTTKEVGKGTGLGLSSALGIIGRHGGFIDVRSTPGCGTVFDVYLPLSSEGECDTPQPVNPDDSIVSGSGLILLAEDDPSMCSFMEELLTGAGYTIITAVNGQDAVEKFTARKADIRLVISDVLMPVKSGKAACDEMRLMSETVKFILMSGHADHVIKGEGDLGTLGSDAVLFKKPIKALEMLTKVVELIAASSNS